MELIDERGRLFGRVNVIDALVVLLAVAVVAAGVALLFGGGVATPGPEDDAPETTVATVALGGHPAYVAGLVRPGNVTTDRHDATITDVYRSPSGDDRIAIFVRLSFEGNRTERGFVVGEETRNPMIVRHGTTFPITTADYQLEAVVQTVGDDRDFATVQRRVVLNASTVRPIADAITVGDTQRIAGEPVATVEAVERTARRNGTVYQEVTLSVTALERDGRLAYGDGRLRLGRTLSFETDQYAINGTVVGIGT